MQRLAQDIDRVVAEAETLGPEAVAKARAAQPLLADLVAHIEDRDTRSAAVLATKVYRFLAEKGIRVELLVASARQRILTRRKARLRHSRKLSGTLDRRLKDGSFVAALQAKAQADGRPMPSKAEVEAEIAAAHVRLATALKRQAAYEEAITAFLKRPRVFSHVPPPERALREDAEPREARTEEHDGRSAPHRFDAPLERIMQKIPARHYQAADRLRSAYFDRGAHAKAGGYGQSAGGRPAWDRDGVSARQQQAGREFRYVWGRLERMEFVREICRVLLFREGKLTPAEWGMRFGQTDWKRSGLLIADTALAVACAVLAPLFEEHDRWWAQEKAAIAARRRAQDEASRR